LGKKRADVVLVERGLFDSRARARAAIEAGGVIADGRSVSKPSDMIEEAAEISAVAAHPYVGRGALKLVHALGLWPILLEGRTVLDVGASTGGFTEVCLERGAARVYAVDVGRGQLHPKLAGDPRVVSLEGVDARDLTPALIPMAPDLIVTDVSFIGLAKALPKALGLAARGAGLVALVKPQFEVGPQAVGKGGVVKDETARTRALEDVAAFLQQSGWIVRETTLSPIVGGDGNIEHLLWAQKA
jgi:23S rRNA (cytidine1920-2'-O)/16S rRNA (cytidine1409-2'-O)-methyltransferase